MTCCASSPLGGNDRALSAGAILVFVSALAYAPGACELFSGRGAYIHFGAVLGTIMVANVFFVIIPGQKTDGGRLQNAVRRRIRLMGFGASSVRCTTPTLRCRSCSL